jgi:hypothetical protein
MTRLLVVDELPLTFRIPAALPAAAVNTLLRTPSGRAFTSALRQAIRRVVRRSHR